jgi:hypothetical protein
MYVRRENTDVRWVGLYLQLVELSQFNILASLAYLCVTKKIVPWDRIHNTSFYS